MKSFHYNFESVRYKHEPKILKVTNLKYCINLFAHDPHMRDLACVAGGIRGHKGRSLKYRLPKN